MSMIHFVTPAMGRSGDPLYMGPLLEGLAQTGFDVAVSTYEQLSNNSCPSVRIGRPIACHRFGHYRFPNVRSVSDLFENDVCVFVVAEFSTLSLSLSLLNSWRRRPSKILLLVENHPKYLEVRRSGPLHTWERRLLTRLVDRVLTNNNEALEYLVGDLGIPAERVVVGPYLTSEFPPGLQAQAPDRAERSGRYRIVAVGQLVQRKGFHLLIAQLAGLSRETRAKINVEIYGAGPEEHALRSLIDACCVSDCVVLRGEVPYLELGRHLLGADLFLNATLRDYRSLVSFEALSLGLPMIMSIHDGALGEVLREGVNGWSYDPNKPGDLARVLAGLPKRRDLQQFGRESRRLHEQCSLSRAIQALSQTLGALGACREHASAK